MKVTLPRPKDDRDPPAPFRLVTLTLVVITRAAHYESDLPHTLSSSNGMVTTLLASGFTFVIAPRDENQPFVTLPRSLSL